MRSHENTSLTVKTGLEEGAAAAPAKVAGETTTHWLLASLLSSPSSLATTSYGLLRSLMPSPLVTSLLLSLAPVNVKYLRLLLHLLKTAGPGGKDATAGYVRGRMAAFCRLAEVEELRSVVMALLAKALTRSRGTRIDPYVEDNLRPLLRACCVVLGPGAAPPAGAKATASAVEKSALRILKACHPDYQAGQDGGKTGKGAEEGPPKRKESVMALEVDDQILVGRQGYDEEEDDYYDDDEDDPEELKRMREEQEAEEDEDENDEDEHDEDDDDAFVRVGGDGDPLAGLLTGEGVMEIDVTYKG